jgi:hypothetical protein
MEPFDPRTRKNKRVWFTSLGDVHRYLEGGIAGMMNNRSKKTVDLY